MWVNKRNIASLILVLSLALTACSPQVRYKILKTIFDDVPAPQHDMSELPTPIKNTDTTLVVAETGVIDKVYYHEPFVKRSCADCHDEQHLGQLTDKEPGLCFNCHDDDFQQKVFLHGPSGAGYCTSCHQPHKSSNENLLIEKGEALCYMCHEQSYVVDSSIHQNISNLEDCVKCHDPHASSKRFLIKKGACNNCHNQVDNKPFVHGPIESGYCSSCHDSHSSPNRNLLVAQGRDLCIGCHDEASVYDDELHQKEENSNCLFCHDPHAGNYKFMLNKN